MIDGDPGSVQVQWQGPFSAGELADRYDTYFTDVNYANPITTTQAVAQALQATDPGWWSVAAANVISGGNSGALP